MVTDGQVKELRRLLASGKTLAAYERMLFDKGAARPSEDLNKPIETVNRTVPPDWTDYNNHMNEARYLQCFADATDAPGIGSKSALEAEEDLAKKKKAEAAEDTAAADADELGPLSLVSCQQGCLRGHPCAH